MRTKIAYGILLKRSNFGIKLTINLTGNIAYICILVSHSIFSAGHQHSGVLEMKIMMMIDNDGFKKIKYHSCLALMGNSLGFCAIQFQFNIYFLRKEHVKWFKV